MGIGGNQESRCELVYISDDRLCTGSYQGGSEDGVTLEATSKGVDS